MRTYSPKKPSEKLRYSLDFDNELDDLETIISASSVLTSRNVSTSGMLVGSVQIDGTKVRQVISGGIVGQEYILSITILTSTNQEITRHAKIPVATYGVDY